MPTEETRYRLAYKLDVLPYPGLTREEIKSAKKIVPGDDYCHAAIVLALMAPGALIVKSCDARMLTLVMPAQNQFEVWKMFTEQLARDGELPYAMKGFLEFVLASYKARA